MIAVKAIDAMILSVRMMDAGIKLVE